MSAPSSLTYAGRKTPAEARERFATFLDDISEAIFWKNRTHMLLDGVSPDQIDAADDFARREFVDERAAMLEAFDAFVAEHKLGAETIH
jgi:hypothetical protein